MSYVFNPFTGKLDNIGDFVTGSGTTNRLTYWNGTNTITGTTENISISSPGTVNEALSFTSNTGGWLATFGNFLVSDAIYIGVWSYGQITMTDFSHDESVLLQSDGTGYFKTSFGVGIIPNAYYDENKVFLNVAAGSTSKAPFRLNSGSLTTGASIIAGNIEFLTDKFYGTITTGTARKEFTLNDAALTAGRVPHTTTNGRLTDTANLTFNGTTLGLGVPTVAVTTSDFTIGISNATKSGLVVQSITGQTAPLIQLQDYQGNSRLVFDPLGENSAMRINYKGNTMASAGYAGFVLSLQNLGDAGEGSWLEILNSGGANTGAFFGMYGDQFQLFNWQGGDIEFWTGTSAGDGRVRLTITDAGNYGFDGTNAYAWGHGWGGGVGIIGIGDCTTQPSTSLTTAVGLFSVSQELWYMAGSNQKRKIVTSAAALTSGKYPITTTNGLLTDGPTPLSGTKVYYVADSSGGAVTRKLTFTDGILTAET